MSQIQTDVQQDQAFRDAIAARYAVLSEGFAKNDAGIIANRFFTPDAWSIGEGEETAINADKIAQLYSDYVGAYSFAAKSVSATRIGNAGWDFAEVTLVSASDKTEVHSYKVLYLWENIDDQWCCRGQMYVEGSFQGAVAGL